MYSNELKKAIHGIKPPKGLIVDITSNEQYPGYVGIRLYENQVMAMSDSMQLETMTYLHLVRSVIESFNLKCHFDGVAGDPPRGTNVS